VGVTLSRRQAAACRRNGLDVHLMDCKDITRDTFGPFDAVASLGAFEHFCSVDQFKAGRQDDVYGRLFENVHGLLPDRGRFFLQTMVFGPNMLPYEELDVNAPHLSDAHVLGLLEKTFPGSWLPYGAEQVEKTAGPHFELVHKHSGRLDYIETIRRWRERFAAPSLRKWLLKLTLAPRYFFDRDFRLAFASGISANTICFERLLLDHYRFVFERR
jgi:cyclopropane-fatty-acyl-phospholipid synthase